MGEDIKGEGRGGVQAGCATYQPPISLSGLYCQGGYNSTGAPERFHYTASRGIISSDISLAVPAGLKFRTRDPPPSARHRANPPALLPGDPQPLPETMEEIVGTLEGPARSRKMADPTLRPIQPLGFDSRFFSFFFCPSFWSMRISSQVNFFVIVVFN